MASVHAAQPVKFDTHWQNLHVSNELSQGVEQLTTTQTITQSMLQTMNPVMVHAGMFTLGQSAAQSTNPQAQNKVGNHRWLWALFAFLIAAFFFALELITVSGGILGLASVVATIVGLVFLFQLSTTLGWIGLAITVCALPFLLMLSLKILPDTPVFRWMMLQDQPKRLNEDMFASRPHVDSDTQASDTPEIGAVGKVVVDLHPSGIVLVDDKRYDAASIHGEITAGALIRVVGHDPFGLRVQIISEDDSAGD